MSNKTATKYGKQIVSNKRELQLVRLGLTKVSSKCQRERDQNWIDQLVSEMNVDELGNPEVSHRDGSFYIMDGQHRIEAIKRWNGAGWEEQHLQCWVWEGLTEEQEAEIFLRLNNRKSVAVFQKFTVGTHAGRPAECEITQIVTDEGLKISTQTIPGAVGCVGALLRIHRQRGPITLRRALCMARDSFGDSGMNSQVIEGFSLLCNRYNGVLDEKSAVQSLSKVHGGVNGLMGSAEQLRQKTGSSKTQCIAAAAVTIINRDRKGAKKLQPWFKDTSNPLVS